MKKHRNPILKGVASRIRQLIEIFEESKTIQHDPTKGSLREAYLEQFLTNFIPHPFVLKSGFVIDCFGDKISPQIDLLAFDKTSIPSFSLTELVTLVPVELVRLAIEVKSVLKASDFAQIKRQQDEIRGMDVTLTTPDRMYGKKVSGLGTPQIVVAFASDCSKKRLYGWIRDLDRLDAICIVGKFIMMRDPNTGQVETKQANTEGGEVMHLVSKVYTTILKSHAEFRKILTVPTPDGILQMEPDIGAYLTFDFPRPDSGPESTVG